MLVVPQFLLAQTENWPCPSALLTQTFEVVEMEAMDVEAAWERADKLAEETGQYLYGVVQDHTEDLAPTVSSDHHAVAVHLPAAAGLALHFSDFHLPAGAQLWVTDLTGSWQEGPYDFRDTDDHGRIATGDVPGEWAVLRLSAPAHLMSDVRLTMEGSCPVSRC